MSAFNSAAEIRQAYIATRDALRRHSDHGPNTNRPARNEDYERGQALRASLRAMEREWDLRWSGDRQAFHDEEDRAHAAAYRARLVDDVARYERLLDKARTDPARFPWLKDLVVANAEQNLASARRKLESLTAERTADARKAA